MTKDNIPQATDFKTLGLQSLQSGKPIVVFVSASWCEFCHAVEQQVLDPAFRAGGYSGFIFTRLLVDGDYRVINFEGQTVTPFDLAKDRYHYQLTPSLFFSNHLGEQLVEPMIGVANIEYYEYLMKKQAQLASQKISS